MNFLNLKNKIDKHTSRFYDWWCSATIGKLPRLYKRSIFISSIYGLLKETKDPNLVNLSKLNELLRINYSKEGFSTGFQVTSLIWHNLEKDPIVHCRTGDFCLFEDNDCPNPYTGSYCVDGISKWLKFASASEEGGSHE